MAKTHLKSLPCGRPLTAEKDRQTRLKEALLKLDAYSQSMKLNRSEAREKILETILDETHHFRALDLLKRLSKKYPNIGKATLYRTLPILVESGVLQEGPSDPEGQTTFEWGDDDHHDHIVCTDCHHIFEFHDEVVEKRQHQLTEKMKFNVKSHRHVIYAACEFNHKED